MNKREPRCVLLLAAGSRQLSRKANQNRTLDGTHSTRFDSSMTRSTQIRSRLLSFFAAAKITAKMPRCSSWSRKAYECFTYVCAVDTVDEDLQVATAFCIVLSLSFLRVGVTKQQDFGEFSPPSQNLSLKEKYMCNVGGERASPHKERT